MECHYPIKLHETYYRITHYLDDDVMCIDEAEDKYETLLKIDMDRVQMDLLIEVQNLRERVEALENEVEYLNNEINC